MNAPGSRVRHQGILLKQGDGKDTGWEADCNAIDVLDGKPIKNPVARRLPSPSAASTPNWPVMESKPLLQHFRPKSPTKVQQRGPESPRVIRKSNESYHRAVSHDQPVQDSQHADYGHDFKAVDGPSRCKPLPASTTFVTVRARDFSTTANGLSTTRFHLPLRESSRKPILRIDQMTHPPSPAVHPPSSRQDCADSGEGEVRTSFRSILTTSSSCVGTSATERSSVATQASSVTDLNELRPDGPHMRQESMSVEDAISMYADGFSDSATQEPENDGKSVKHSPSQHDRSKFWTENQHKSADVARQTQGPSGAATFLSATLPEIRSSTQIMTGTDYVPTQSTEQFTSTLPVPRDRYMFKKASLYITVEQYNSWNATYEKYLDRRRKKWMVLMKQHSLPIESPTRFPPRSDKVKRYVRKGVPPEWRGAAWFWYADGYSHLAKSPGLYQDLVSQAESGKISETDREHIERDLHRTFPDNLKFKLDVTEVIDKLDSASISLTNDSPTVSGEVPILSALRRVLQAFAIHNPEIGYCQSLNFLAGNLLLFLMEDEEKAFIMLNIITTTHLPGTHGIALEGANVDIGVLMTAVRDSMPAVWAKITNSSDQPTLSGKRVGNQTDFLPPVSLATTAWFMSCFIGTLPTESVLRVWDSLFYEGSKTLFRVALAIFKIGESEICQISDSMEIFQVVQTIPRRLVDANALMSVCLKKRNGFGYLSQQKIDAMRAERRRMHADERRKLAGSPATEQRLARESKQSAIKRATSKARLQRFRSRRGDSGKT